MTRLPPVLDCRSLVSPIEEVIGSLSGSFVSLTSVTDVQDNLMTIADNNPGLMFRHTLPNGKFSCECLSCRFELWIFFTGSVEQDQLTHIGSLI